MFSFMLQFGAPTAFKRFIDQLESGGILYIITDLILPLFLIFALMYAILQKVMIFKVKDTDEPNTKVNVTISILLALFVVIPHITGVYPPGKDPIIIIKNILPGAMIILIAILLFLAMINLSGGEAPNILSVLVLFAAIFFLFYIIAAAVFPKMQWGPIKDPGVQVLLIAILIAILWIWFLIKPPTTKAKTWLEHLMAEKKSK